MDMQFEYDYDTEGMRLVKYTGQDNRVVIPNEYNGEKVTSIGPYVFVDMKDADIDGQNVMIPKQPNFNVQEVILPEGIIEICYCTFMECRGLTSINLPDNIQYIGPSAFYQCQSIKEITIPKSLRMILRGCFRNCSELKKVKMSHVNEIEFSAFEGCKKLEEIDFGNELYWVGKRAFENCEKIADLIPDTVIN
ncbi:MAG: leucine-rich repeat domain-containing protein [Pseudobutyrivibrio sp.]|uniref:leucine-rich repeat domain-containing protein n=1 Tax=Pseudobutyrivibrio sp. TaxID=2014367 RepID=UPI0025F28E01|nr:leucine-rich repeat domain-containing protein [Pseudobutyrivibrio sp.]MBQ8488781.1 leucine-rich repeat domain-containing protein [Pseudobutyrivibrio sp.]